MASANPHRPITMDFSSDKPAEEVKKWALKHGLSEKDYNDKREWYNDEAGEDGVIDFDEFKHYMKKKHGKEKWAKIKQLAPGLFKIQDVSKNQVCYRRLFLDIFLQPRPT